MNKINSTKVGILRRFMSILYDILLVSSLLIISSIIYLLLFGIENIRPNSQYFVLYQIFVLLNICTYFIYFWYKNGQTIGMRAWKFKLIFADNYSLVTKISLLFLRLFLALITNIVFFVGILSSALSKDRMSIYDKLTKTKLYRLTN